MLDIIITIFCILVLVCLWIMIYDGNRFVIKEYTCRDKRIRRNFRAVVIADLHNKKYGKDNEKLLGAIRECKPDMILVAGDIPTATPGAKLDTAIGFMEKLAEEFPVYYGNGNHEHRMKLYPETYGDMSERYGAALERMGIEPLVNAHVKLEQFGVSIYGAEIDRFYYKRFGVQPMEEDYLRELLGEPEAEVYTILLAHNPDYFPKYVSWGADLVLSGHVHGGLVRIPFWGRGVASPNIRFFPKYDGGRFEQNKTVMLLSRGLGMHTIPVRLFNPGELLVVDFSGENS